jgi:uncharacterized membrane protein YqiK
MNELAKKNTITYDTSSVNGLVKQAEQFNAQAKRYVITSENLYKAAADDLANVKAFAKTVDEQRKAITQPLDVAKKSVMALYNPAVDFLEDAEIILKAAMVKYVNEQERIAAESRRVAEVAAAAERAELVKQAAEALAQALAAEQAVKAAAETGNTEAAAVAQQKLEEATAQTNAVAMQAQLVIAAPVATMAKIAGTSTQVRWNATVRDFKTLVDAVAKGSVPIEALLPNETFLNNQAKALKDNLQYPGVCAVPTTIISQRAA